MLGNGAICFSLLQVSGRGCGLHVAQVVETALRSSAPEGLGSDVQSGTGRHRVRVRVQDPCRPHFDINVFDLSSLMLHRVVN